ncbi:hypothetical protein F53441_3175 [Fusarium austroafricanum]|uniref:Uncharacterized protein n=1 Tax=Fusarium austroafricanum TaxID=2364996 RepID=A0A8H4KQP6_9HYPO|nr:hypothetical protein F53441_3175 [Fusarium austroafricanum]
MTSTREGAGWFRQMFSSSGYQELPTTNVKDKTENTQIMPRRLIRLSTRGFLLVLAAILLVPTLLALAALEGRQYLSDGTADVFEMGEGQDATTETAASPAGIPVMANPPPMEVQNIFNRRLVVLLPANTAGVNLCKAMVTAIALGYPAPVIINWGKSGSHLAKIAGVLDYLDWSVRQSVTSKDRLNPDDLIMVADSADSWFQLPPAVLLQRYHALNAEANERLRKQWPGKSEMPMKQTIMVSAQKRCWPQPKSGSELHCDALPESPLRKDLYGPETDTDPSMRMVDVRPRYINSGAFIGPVGDMRKYFRRAQERYVAGKAIQGNHFYSDQGIFGEIWGEQEMWRTWRRELGDAIDPQNNASAMVRDQFEFHVGLDYNQTISIPTVFEEDDGDIVELNNQTYIAERSRELEINPVRLTGVPDDIVNVTNPLERILSQEDSRTLDWGDMTLYADFFTTAIPVNVHHNAHINNLKGRRIWWWDRMWFFPYLRQLVKAQLTQRRQLPLGRVEMPEGRAVYWGLEGYKQIRRFMPAERELVVTDFDSICMSNWAKKEKQNWWDVVFMDDLGPLML